MNVIWISGGEFGGDKIFYDAASANAWRDQGHTVDGPYFHQSDMLPSCVACPECGAEVDTRTAEAL